MNNISTEIAFLTRLWLPEKAARIYGSLLEIGEATVSDIALRSELHRPEVYRFLPILLEKKLIAAIEKGKRTFYQALDPSALDSLRSEFIETSEVVLQRLKARHDAKSLKASLTHYKGLEALSKIYVDALRLTPNGENYLRYSSGVVRYERSMYATPDYERLKKSKKVGRLMIANGYAKRKFSHDPNREIYEIPKDFPVFDDNISKLIYADRVAIIDHDMSEAFVIESERFAEYERKIFHYLRKFIQERNRDEE